MKYEQLSTTNEAECSVPELTHIAKRIRHKMNTLDELASLLGRFFTPRLQRLYDVETLEELIASEWSAMDVTDRRDLLDRARYVVSLLEKLECE